VHDEAGKLRVVGMLTEVEMASSCTLVSAEPPKVITAARF